MLVKPMMLNFEKLTTFVNILGVDLVVPILKLYWLCRALVELWIVVIDLVL